MNLQEALDLADYYGGDHSFGEGDERNAMAEALLLLANEVVGLRQQLEKTDWREFAADMLSGDHERLAKHLPPELK